MATPLEESILRTQEVLQPLIQKPQLKEKFLQKPPFRFLHDIVTALIKSQGFPEGLYEGNELDSGSYKDKESKLEFLTKLILCVGICRGRSLEIRETKVVAGLEPEKTNELLQEMAYAATDTNLDIPEAVRRTLANQQPSPDTIPRQGTGQSLPSSSEAKEASDRRTSIQDDPKDRRTQQEQRDHHQEEEVPLAPSESKFTNEYPAPMDRGEAKFSTLSAGPTLSDDDLHGCDGSIEKTRSLLEPIIDKKPKLTEKLLGKPPFRFLHDLISEVTRRTGFAQGLYDEIESDSSQVSDKTAKINYLNKIIQLVSMQLNVAVEARPAKIVSGLEAEDTNRFLQLLALAASRLPDSQANVAIINKTNADTTNRAEAKSTTRPLPPQDEIPARERRPPPKEDDEPMMPDVDTTAKDTEIDDEPPAPLGAMAAVAQPKRTGRPQTARRKPPRYKEKSEDEIVKTPAVKTSIIIDGADDDDDDDEVDDKIAAEEEENKMLPGLTSGISSANASSHIAEGKSKLVREIQEEERLAAKAHANDSTENNEEKSTGIRFGRIDRGAASKHGRFADTDVDELMSTVQKLCQSTNPLGKCMDYVHEDLSTMNKELDKWQLEFQVQKDLLERERRDESDQTILSLRRTLKDLDDQISDEVRLTRAVKARIIKHESRIQTLLTMVCTSTYNPSEFAHLAAANDDHR